MANKTAYSVRITTSVAEVTVLDRSAILYGIYPEVATTAGTVTVREGLPAATGVVKYVAPTGLTVAGVTFGPHGMFCGEGLTVQKSATGDQLVVVFEPF